MQYLNRFLFTFLFLFFSLCQSYAIEEYREKKSYKNLFFNTDSDIKIKLEISDADVKTFNKTVDLLNKNKWSESLSWADSIKSEHMKDAMIEYVLWKKYSSLDLSSANEEFSSLLSFIEGHQYLPNIKNLKEKAETMYLRENIPYVFVEKYFNQIEPVSPAVATKIMIEKHKSASNRNDKKLEQEIKNTFYKYNFSESELKEFVSYFSNYLKESDYVIRIENYMWDKDYDRAGLLFSQININLRNLYASIIEIENRPKYINDILRRLHKDLRNNELLEYSKFMYYYRTKDNGEAVKVLLSVKKNKDRPELWWKYQNFYARELIKDKEYKKAYFLASNVNLPRGSSNYSESEWLSGWILLTFLNKPLDAHQHFSNMFNAVSYPISSSRAAYWAGRAMEAAGKKKEALEWYDKGAWFSLYFYGQLSFHAKNELLGKPSLMASSPLPESPKYTKVEENAVLNSNIVKMAYIMAKGDDNEYDCISLFKSAISLSKSRGERAAIFEVIKNTQNEKIITIMAKYLTYRNVYYVDNLFPVLNIINIENPSSNLIHAIIKQESGFHVSAQSRVGASGFMQLMPETAKDVASRMKLKYDQRALKTNPEYNILLGSYYINMLIRQFNGSQVLAIASYNAGPTPVKRWINNYGDPRDMKDIKDIVNWIESIGYEETRNYVQRITENAVVYEYILENMNNKVKKELKEEIKENEEKFEKQAI